MTKSELCEAVAAKNPTIAKRDIVLIVDLMFDVMTKALAAKDRIEIRGFGSFATKQRRARAGRNPRTGTSVEVPEKWVAAFTVGKELRERLNDAAAKTPDKPKAD